MEGLRGRFGLVDTPGDDQWKQISLAGAAFDQDASYFQCGGQKARLKQSGHSFEVVEPTTFRMTGSDPLAYARRWWGTVPKSESALWVEPGDKPGSIVITTDVAGIPAATLEILGISSQVRPNLKLQFHVIPRAGGGFELPFLFGEGTEYWGATKGPVDLGGKQFSKLRGAKVTNGDLRQER